MSDSPGKGAWPLVQPIPPARQGASGEEPPTSKPLALIADDMEDSRFYLKSIIDDLFDVIECSSGSSCLVLSQVQEPDIIFLDINLEDISGYEVCRLIKKNPNTANIPVIFVSAYDSPQEILKGYEYGAEGYVTKPFAPDTVLDRTRHIIHQIKAEETLTQKIQSASCMAFEAMTSASEIGLMVRFSCKAAAVSDLQTLVETGSLLLSELGLSGALSLSLPSGDYAAGTNNPLELSLIAKSREAGTDTFSEFGPRLIGHGHHTSVLIRNMPVRDQTACGRIRDNLALLLGIVDTTAEAIDLANRSAMAEQMRFASDIISGAQQKLALLKDEVAQRETALKSAMQDMQAAIHNIQASSVLDADQADALLVFIESVDSTVSSGCEFNANIGALVEQLATSQRDVIRAGTG